MTDLYVFSKLISLIDSRFYFHLLPPNAKNNTNNAPTARGDFWKFSFANKLCLKPTKPGMLSLVSELTMSAWKPLQHASVEISDAKTASALMADITAMALFIAMIGRTRTTARREVLRFSF